MFLRDYGPTEVGGFGICPQEALLVEDIQLVKQRCSYLSVQFDDVSVAEMFEEQVDEGLRPDQFARIWIHTHPGKCPRPSITDESTLARVFGKSDWAVMFILARGGSSYARLGMNIEPKIETELQTVVDYSHEFAGSDQDSWAYQFEQLVFVEDPCSLVPKLGNRRFNKLGLDTSELLTEGAWLEYDTIF